MDEYILDKVKKIKKELKLFFGSNPPDKIVYERLKNIIEDVYKDGYDECNKSINDLKLYDMPKM